MNATIFVLVVLIRILLAPAPANMQAVEDDQSYQDWSYSELLCDQCSQDLDETVSYYHLPCKHDLCGPCFLDHKGKRTHCPICKCSLSQAYNYPDSDLFEDDNHK